MIDTDRYEGHTEGPWHFCIGYDIETDTYTGPSPLKGGGDRVNGPVILSNYQFERGTAGHQADLKLIEDAPLLLAEVKKLRKQCRHWESRLGEAEDVIQYALDTTSDDDAKSVFEDFLEVSE